MRILVTGANGTVGTAIYDQLDGKEAYEFTWLDKLEHPERDTLVTDIKDYDDTLAAIEGHDVVIHLAGVVELEASWERVLETNIIGTYNVIEACSEADVSDVIFASTNHTNGIVESELAPELYDPSTQTPVLQHTDPVRPDSLYGVSKVFGEALGRYYVESATNPVSEFRDDFEAEPREHPNRFYSLRILSVRSEPYDHPYGPAEKGVQLGLWERGSGAYEFMVNRLKCTWLSHRDLAQLIEKCLEDTSVKFDIFWACSDNDGRWVDLEHGRTVLGYRPQDNGAEWNGPPS